VPFNSILYFLLGHFNLSALNNYDLQK